MADMRAEIAKLTAFLPEIEKLGPEEAVLWTEPVVSEDGVLSLGANYRYAPVVDRLLEAMEQDPWIDRDYKPHEAGELAADAERLARADLAEIRRVTTYLVRGERFSYAHFGELVEDGTVGRVLRRLAELRDGMS